MLCCVVLCCVVLCCVVLCCVHLDVRAARWSRECARQDRALAKAEGRTDQGKRDRDVKRLERVLADSEAREMRLLCVLAAAARLHGWARQASRSKQESSAATKIQVWFRKLQSAAESAEYIRPCTVYVPALAVLCFPFIHISKRLFPGTGAYSLLQARLCRPLLLTYN